jgi:hypothetical protein
MSKVYPEAVIYKISTSDNSKVYYGSTNNFKKRKSVHLSSYKKHLMGGAVAYLTAFEVLSDPDCKFEILTTLENISKQELQKLESDYILNNPCVNRLKIYGNRAKSQQVGSQKYYEQNKDKIKNTVKYYYEQNKDKKTDYQAEYREKNKAKIKAKAKQYYEQNKDKAKKYYQENKEKINDYITSNKAEIEKKQSEKIQCECGTSCRRDSIARHKQSRKHTDYEASKTINITITNSSNITINSS